MQYVDHAVASQQTTFSSLPCSLDGATGLVSGQWDVSRQIRILPGLEINSPAIFPAPSDLHLILGTFIVLTQENHRLGVGGLLVSAAKPILD